MKRIATALAAASVYCLFAGEAQEAALSKELPNIFAKSVAHYRAIDAKATPLMRNAKGDLMYPHGWKAQTGELDMRTIRGWTSGHFPGTLWYLHEATGDASLREMALKWTKILEPNSKLDRHHDIGFIMNCSFGNARRILKADSFDAILVESAESLCRRYKPSLGLIRSWGKIDETKTFLVIPDNLMNLELLEVAAKISGNARFSEIARSHAKVTAKHHFRADGGTYHVLNYDQDTGRVMEYRRGQGASTETAWSRGQSWAIYGYSMMYRETKDPFFLEMAEKCADFALNHPNMPEDGVPFWDYGAPGEERDSSAGAIMASALLELSEFLPAMKGSEYRAFAVKALTSLASPAYFAAEGENGDFLLKHGVGARPAGKEIDTPLNYGDYYFVEALLRFKALRAKGSFRLQNPDRVAQIVSLLTDRPFLADAHISNRAAWNAFAATSQGKTALRHAKDCLKQTIPDCPDALYLEFSTPGNGNRTHYEKPYFARASMLHKLLLGECLENKGRFIPKIVECVDVICAEKSWTMPAHDRSLNVFKGKIMNVDLGAGHRATTCAYLIAMLKGVLPAAAEAKLRGELERRIFAPMRRCCKAKQSGGCSPMGWFQGHANWTAVCHSCVTRSALAVLEDRMDRAMFVEAAERSVPGFLGGFTDDGYCSEGLGYWNYGWDHFLTLTLAVREATGGKVDFCASEKARTVMKFGTGVLVSGSRAAPIADGGGSLDSAVLQLGHVIWPDLPMTPAASKRMPLKGGLSRFTLLDLGQWNSVPPAPEVEYPVRTEFPFAGMYVLRPGGSDMPFGLGVKAGHNGEFHNHNDVGTYALVIGSREVCGDCGGTEYTAKTFSKHRYEHPLLNSYGHPVPVLNGALQPPGQKFAGKVLETSFTPERDRVVFDILGAYAHEQAKATRLERTFIYDRQAKRVTVSDKVAFDGKGTFSTPILTAGEMKPSGGKGIYTLSLPGDNALSVQVAVSVNGADWKMEDGERLDNPNRVTPTRYAITLVEPVAAAEVSVAYSLPAK